MGHTPGPWTLHGWGDNDYEINAAEGTVCNVPGFDDDTVESNMAEHNARLIAAAPELLAALRRMREVFEQLADGDWRHLDATYVDQLIESDGLHGCDKALAKAEGRSE